MPTRGRDTLSRVEYLREKYGAENVYYVERARKHRYVFFCGNKTERWKMKSSLKYKVEDYPKGKSDRYKIEQIETQQSLFS